MKKFDNPIEELTNRINQHLQNGGNIYQPKRQLPYYDYLSNVKTRFSKRDKTKYETADIYKMCGFDFDPEYATFLEIMADLQDLADENNYVDKNTNFKHVKSETYGKLCTLATKHNSCLYDFLVLTTGYRLKESHIDLDYEKALIERLTKAYPNKDLAGIRRNNTDLYEMIRHLKKYKYPELTIDEVVNLLGFENSRTIEGTSSAIDENFYLEKLNQMFPTKVIDQSLHASQDVYYKFIKLSLSKKQSLVEYLNQHGYTYLQGNLVARCAQMKVDENARYKFLANKKMEFYKNHSTENLTYKDLYYLNLQLVDQIAKVDNVEEFIKQKEAQMQQ